MIYETKGLTLEQVDELYAEVTDARKSIGWTPSLTFRDAMGANEKDHRAVQVEEQERTA